MARREAITPSAFKGHRTNVVIEDPVYQELEKHVGKTKRWATKGHAVNECLAKELGVTVE